MVSVEIAVVVTGFVHTIARPGSCVRMIRSPRWGDPAFQGPGLSLAATMRFGPFLKLLSLFMLVKDARCPLGDTEIGTLSD